MSDVKVDPVTLSIAKKIYENYGQKGLQDFIENGSKDIPPVKLTQKEMEHLKGGKFSWPTTGIGRGVQQALQEFGFI